MTRLRALLWALCLLAVAYPAVTTPVLAAAGAAVQWLGGQPTVLLTAAALVLAGWALRPRRAARPARRAGQGAA